MDIVTFKSKKMRSGLTKKVGEIAILVIDEPFSYGMRIPLPKRGRTVESAALKRGSFFLP